MKLFFLYTKAKVNLKRTQFLIWVNAQEEDGNGGKVATNW